MLINTLTLIAYKDSTLLFPPFMFLMSPLTYFYIMCLLTLLQLQLFLILLSFNLYHRVKQLTHYHIKILQCPEFDSMIDFSSLLHIFMCFYKKAFYFLKILFIYFQGGGREGKRKGEKHQCVVAPCTLPTGDLACNPGMCPAWELNQQPFGSQVHSQSTELHQPGPYIYVFMLVISVLSFQLE